MYLVNLILLSIAVTLGTGVDQSPNIIPPEDLTPTSEPQRPPVGDSTVIFVTNATEDNATEAPQDTTSFTSSNGSCYPEPVTPNTPTGIAGCERWGVGIASHYGPGEGVAMNFCTWSYRTKHGCGWVNVKSLSSGRTVTVPVIDFCDCYTTTPRERIIDLQWGVVEALGLSTSQGLYKVEVWPAN